MSDYRETKPAATASGVVCKVCAEEVAKITFRPDDSSIGVCACPWTSWVFDTTNTATRSTPRGYE